MRLNRYLSQCGLGSRRGCEQIILEGRVAINSKRVSELGTLVKPEDEVTVDGKPVRTETGIVIALNKPKGYICSRSDERDRMTIYALLPRQLQSLHHVGRLDKESEGLLLMTNRGDLSHHLIHPSKGAEKEYEVVVDKPLDQAVMAKLVKGMMTEEGHAKAERAWMITGYRCHVVLKQGLKRQIRLMFYQLGFEVERLTRTRIGWLELKGLPKGSWKELSEAEIQRFFTEAGTTGRQKPAGEAKKPDAKPSKARPGSAWDDGDDLAKPAKKSRSGPQKRGGPAKKFGSSSKPTGRARYQRPEKAERFEPREREEGGDRRPTSRGRYQRPERSERFEPREREEGGDRRPRSGGGGRSPRGKGPGDRSGPPRKPSGSGPKGPRRPSSGGRSGSKGRF